MSRKRKYAPKSWLAQRVPKGFHGYPLATVALYGPTAELATKIAVGIFRSEKQDPDLLQRWFSQELGLDVRTDSDVCQEVLAFLKENRVRSVALMDSVFGCPHEEGIDYPEGVSCPHCPYWAGRDRSTLERIQ
jgi:hypothetical protein